MIKFTPAQVKHVANLANIPVDAKAETKLAKDFADTLEVIANLQELDVSQTEPTHQVTGLENVWREDKVTKELMFTQDQATANAQQTDGGFFIVPRIIDRDES